MSLFLLGSVLSLFSSSSLSEWHSGEVALGGFSAGEMSFLLLIAMRLFLEQILMDPEYSLDSGSMLGNVCLNKRLAKCSRQYWVVRFESSNLSRMLFITIRDKAPVTLWLGDTYPRRSLSPACEKKNGRLWNMQRMSSVWDLTYCLSWVTGDTRLHYANLFLIALRKVSPFSLWAQTVTPWLSIPNSLRSSAFSHCACFSNAVLLAVTCSLLAVAAASVSITKAGCLSY